MKEDSLKHLANTLLGCAEIYGERAWAADHPFVPGVTPIPSSGKVLGGPELKAVMAAALDGVLTEGRWVERFEKGLSVYIGRRFASMCNSGSSANLLAVTALMQPDAPEGLRLKPGDEVVTAAACFPTTVNPIIQNGLVPVFVDVELGTYVPTIQALEAAIGPKTKAFMLAHSLGNPFPVAKLASICNRHHMALIEDNCDSLGSKHQGKMTGTLGDLATQSFYPAHHLTSLDADEFVLLRAPDGSVSYKRIGPFVEGGAYRGWQCVSFDRGGTLRWASITGVVRHDCREPLVRVVLEGGRAAVVSMSHSLFALRNGNIVTVAAGGLGIGDFVLAPRYLPGTRRVLFVPYTRYAMGSWRAEPAKLRLTEDTAGLLGWFAAEGSLYHSRRGNYTVQFSLGPHERAVAEHLEQTIRDAFGARTTIHSRGPSGFALVMSSKAMYGFLEEACGTGAARKRVPPFLFDAPKGIRKAFLEAYLQGDGHHRNQRGEHDQWEAKTVSKELALGIHALLLGMRLSPRFSVARESRRDFGSYISPTLPIYSVAYGTSGRGRANAVSFRGSHGADKRPRRFGDLVLLKITKLEEVAPTTAYVYDLAVAGYENFVAGIGMTVHNTGEGGAVLTSSPILRKIVESLRDWGRSCWCDPGKDNTCGNRFSTDLPRLPPGYDHKYTYSRIGYNLKSTDLQAAIGVAQLARLPAFAEARKDNFDFLRSGLCDLEDVIIIPQPTVGSKPNWFGFPITLRAGLSRNLVIRYLEDKKVATRLLFAGNILRQPGYVNIKRRKVGPLTNTDIVVARTFWVGVWPGITPVMAAYMVEVIHEAIRVAKKSARRKQQDAILDGAE